MKRNLSVRSRLNRQMESISTEKLRSRLNTKQSWYAIVPFSCEQLICPFQRLERRSNGTIAFACELGLIVHIFYNDKVEYKDNENKTLAKHSRLFTVQRSTCILNEMSRAKTYFLQKVMGKQVNMNLKIAFQEQSWCLLNVSIKETLKSGSSTYSNDTSVEC